MHRAIVFFYLFSFSLLSTGYSQEIPNEFLIFQSKKLSFDIGENWLNATTYGPIRFKRLAEYDPGSKILSQILAQTTQGAIDSFHSPGVRKFKCYQGQKPLVLIDICEVFAYKILDDKRLGNTRDFNYKIQVLLRNIKSKEVIDFIKAKKCACTWECAINSSQNFNDSSWPALGIRSLVN